MTAEGGEDRPDEDAKPPAEDRFAANASKPDGAKSGPPERGDGRALPFLPGRPPAEPGSAQARLREGISSRASARRTKTLALICGSLSVVVLAVAGIGWGLSGYLNTEIRRVDAGTTGGTPGAPLNILAAGIDTREGLTSHEAHVLHVGYGLTGTNSDTMLIVHISPAHSAVTVVSLPRDSWVSIPGHGMNKINAAFGLGGPKLMVKTVEQATGLTINDYVAVNFLGFIKMINALGGVNVCVPHSLDDPYSGLRLTAGRHHVDGLTALEFVRDRHSFPQSDLTRITNQQRLLASSFAQAVRAGLLVNPVRLGSFVHAAATSVTADRGLDVTGLADELRGISLDNVRFTTVPLASDSYSAPDGQLAVLWNKAAAGQLFNNLANDTDSTARPTSRPARSGTPGSRRSAQHHPGGHSAREYACH